MYRSKKASNAVTSRYYNVYKSTSSDFGLRASRKYDRKKSIFFLLLAEWEFFSNSTDRCFSISAASQVNNIVKKCCKYGILAPIFTENMRIFCVCVQKSSIKFGTSTYWIQTKSLAHVVRNFWRTPILSSVFFRISRKRWNSRSLLPLQNRNMSLELLFLTWGSFLPANYIYRYVMIWFCQLTRFYTGRAYRGQVSFYKICKAGGWELASCFCKSHTCKLT